MASTSGESLIWKIWATSLEVFLNDANWEQRKPFCLDGLAALWLITEPSSGPLGKALLGVIAFFPIWPQRRCDVASFFFNSEFSNIWSVDSDFSWTTPSTRDRNWDLLSKKFPHCLWFILNVTWQPRGHFPRKSRAHAGLTFDPRKSSLRYRELPHKTRSLELSKP